MPLTPGEGQKSNFVSKYLSPCRTFGLKRKSKSPGSLSGIKKSSPVVNDNAAEHIVSKLSNANSSIPHSSHSTLTLTNFDATVSPKSVINIDSPKYTVETLQLPNTPFTEPESTKSQIVQDQNNLHPTPKRKFKNVSNPKFKNPAILEKYNKEDKSFNTVCNTDILTPKSHLKTKESLCTKSCKNEEVGRPIKQVQVDESKMESQYNKCSLTELEIPQKINLLVGRINEKVEKLRHLKNKGIYSKKQKIEEVCVASEQWKCACIEALERLHSQLRAQGDMTTSLSDLIRAHSIPPYLISFNVETEEFT